MSSAWPAARLEDLIVEHPKSKLKARESKTGAFPFFTSGVKVGSADDFICEGDNLFIATGGRASVKYYEGKAAYSTDCYSVTSRRGVVPKFIFYFLTSILDQIDEQMFEGAALRHLQKERFRNVVAPVPPYYEQERLVGLLDEAWVGIATARRNTERNIDNARAVFESHLQAVFTNRGSEWDRVPLSTLLERGWIEGHQDGNHGENYPRKNEFVAEGIPYVSANCIEDDRLEISRAKYLSPQRAALIRTGIARDNDVLFAHNATVGPVAILHTDQERVILSTSLTYYRCNPKHILPRYLAHYMRSFGFRTQYLSVMAQSTRNQVPITKQREFYHVIPPLDEQRSLIRALDGIFDNGQRLQAIYHRKLAALDDLKQSLLHQAFSGML